MLPAHTIIRFLTGLRQKPREQLQIKIQQERAVKDQRVSLASLGVAGELHVANGQVGDTTHFHVSAQRGSKRLRVTPHNVTISAGDGLQRRVIWLRGKRYFSS